MWLSSRLGLFSRLSNNDAFANPLARFFLFTDGLRARRHRFALLLLLRLLLKTIVSCSAEVTVPAIICLLLKNSNQTSKRINDRKYLCQFHLSSSSSSPEKIAFLHQYFLIIYFDWSVKIWKRQKFIVILCICFDILFEFFKDRQIIPGTITSW